jgi:CubicO group peptidase (beta-lactamase class C family)
MKNKLQLLLLSIITSLTCLTSSNVFALNMAYGTTDIYDGSQLHIAIVQVGPAIYRDVFVTIKDIISINGGPVYVGIDTYDGATNQLTIPDVVVGTTHYTNLVVTIDAVKKVGYGFPQGVRVNGIEQFCYKVDCVASLSKLSMNYAFRPSGSPLPLPTNTNLTANQKALVASATSIINSVEGNVALVIVENGQIIFEHYHPLIDEKTPLLSQSMGKSMTSMAIGQAMCTGLLPNLDVLAKDVNPLLNGLSYGDSTIRQLLMMSSGGTLSSSAKPGWPSNVTNGNPTLPMYFDTYLQISSYGDKQVMPDGSFLKPGTVFSYKDFDNLSLSFMFINNGYNNFPDIFQNYIWNFFGAESQAYVLKDDTGLPITDAGYLAIPRDWARVGVGINNILNANKNDCFTNYLKTATSQQIVNNNLGPDYYYNPNFSGYGYQFWTGGINDLPGTITMTGAWGQAIKVNPAKNRVMYYATYQLTPSTPTPAGPLDKMFAAWK